MFKWPSLVLLYGAATWGCESKLKPNIEAGVTLSEPQQEAPEPRESVSVSPMLRPPSEPEICESRSGYVPPMVIRRLTRAEYRNTARSLIGVDVADLVGGFPPEEEVNGFDNQSKSLQVSALHVEQFLEASERLADIVVNRFETLSPCVPINDEADRCISSFIKDFGLKAWRRPLSESEVSRLLGLYRAGVEGAKEDLRAPQAYLFGELDPVSDGISLVVSALLQSPHFLYRVEIGSEAVGAYVNDPEREEGDIKRLSDYELASRLSYLLWKDMPDDQLFSAAAAGQLNDPEVLISQAERMLLDPKASEGLWSFFEQWLAIDEVADIDKDQSIFPTYNNDLNALLETEARLFIEDIVFEQRDLRRLFNSPQTFINARLASHYARGGEGAERGPTEVVLSEEWAFNVDPKLSEEERRASYSVIPNGDSFQRVDLNPQRRSGLLTRGAVLALTTKPNMGDPVHRGLYIRERLLCTPLPPPPPDIVVIAPDPDPTLTTREQFGVHSSEPACEGCHKLVDPLGFGLESFDPMGRFRTLENGKPIDDSGEIISTLDIDGTFVGSQALGQRLAESEQVQRCVVLNLMRYAHGRSESPGELCDIDSHYGQFQSSGYDFLTLLRSIISSPAFSRLHIDRALTTAQDAMSQRSGE